MICGWAETRSGATSTKFLKAMTLSASGRHRCHVHPPVAMSPFVAPARSPPGPTRRDSGGPLSPTAARHRWSRVALEWVEPALQQAELVALGVGQDVPALVAALADVGPDGTERQQSFELGVLVPIGGVDVDVQPHLAGCRVGHRAEDEGRRGASEAGPGADLDRAVLLPAEDAVVEHGRPERGEGLGVAAVDDELGEAAGHGHTVGRNGPV